MQALLERLEKLRFETEWESPTELSVDMLLGDQNIGMMLFERIPPRKIACQKQLDDLRSKGMEADGVWAVVASGINPEQRRKGYGKAMYEAGIKQLRAKHGTVYISSNECEVAGSTSPEAQRVWTSLARKYPSSGRVLYVRK